MAAVRCVGCILDNRHEYTVGEMTIHSGLVVHQIGTWRYASGDEARITIQGFGFRCGDDWYLYW